MTIVPDASVVVAALTDTGPVGAWAEAHLETEHLAAPHLLPVEVADVLRRAAQAGTLTQDVASLAHAELAQLPVELFPYGPLAVRAWELRHNVSAYDAWYVALAEAFDAVVVTLDVRLTRATGPRCGFRTPAG